MKSEKNEKLFGRTDYAVKAVSVLIMMGAIPGEFVEFHPDRGLDVDYFITSFMEYFPKKTLSDPWMEVFGNSIQHALNLIKLETEQRQDVREFGDGEIHVSFSDTAKLSRQLNMKQSNLDTLLRLALDQNPDLQPFLMHDRRAGYLVSSFLLKRLDKAGVRLDQYIGKLVSGKTKFAVN